VNDAKSLKNPSLTPIIQNESQASSPSKQNPEQVP
jgi:hypothetical protein